MLTATQQIASYRIPSFLCIFSCCYYVQGKSGSAHGKKGEGGVKVIA